jgi:hypothetical protein
LILVWILDCVNIDGTVIKNNFTASIH